MINAMKKHLDELKWPAPRTISKMQVRRPLSVVRPVCPPLTPSSPRRTPSSASRCIRQRVAEEGSGIDGPGRQTWTDGAQGFASLAVALLTTLGFLSLQRTEQSLFFAVRSSGETASATSADNRLLSLCLALILPLRPSHSPPWRRPRQARPARVQHPAGRPCSATTQSVRRARWRRGASRTVTQRRARLALGRLARWIGTLLTMVRMDCVRTRQLRGGRCDRDGELWVSGVVQLGSPTSSAAS